MFSKQASFIKSVKKGSPLSSTFRINANGYLIPLLTKKWPVNFLCKTDTRKPNFPLSNRWKSLVPDVLHLAISSSVKRTSTEARAAVDISVPFVTILVTLVRCASVGPWLRDTNG